MSVWRSPVFYFGIALVLLVTAALAAPYVVPWNNYRGKLEATGQKLTGRDVLIGGPIEVKLFPWPQLVAHDVAIGNPAAFSEGVFVRADTVRVRLSLAGLFSGSLDVESVDIEKPVVNLQRNASGDVNWIFAPTEKVAGQGLLQRVKLDQITVVDGLVSYDDLRNARSLVFTDLDATLSAQSILGPWRLNGATKFNDVPMNVVVTTSVKEADTPLKFTIKLLPTDLSVPMVATEGEWDGKAFNGSLRVDPQEQSGQKSSAEGLLKPLTFQAKVEATAERASLLNIRITPFDRKDSGTLIEGAAVAEFGTETQVRLDLKAPRVNLDSLLSGVSLQKARDGGLLQVVNHVMAALPSKVIADYSISVNTLTSGGQALNDVRLSGSAQNEAIRIKELVAELPGRSVGAFDGVLFPGAEGAQLAGKFKFESSDTRGFVSWLSPQWRAVIDKHWTGSRGRLVIQAGDLTWNPKSFVVENVAFKLDEAPGHASYTTTAAPGSDSTLVIDSEYLDVDSFVSNGLSVVRDGGLQSFANLLAQDMDATPVSRRFRVRAAKLLLNGVTADDVAFDVAASAGALEVKLFDIGSVRGARLHGGGALVDKGNGPEGSVEFHLQAQDPQGFMRLTGFEYGKANWTQALGATTVEAVVRVVPQKTGPELKFVARGSSGALNGEVVLSANDIAAGTGANLAVSGGINSSSSAALIRLLGVEAQGGDSKGDLAFEFSGSADRSFVFSSRLSLFGAVGQAAGTADMNKAFMGLSGKVSVEAEAGTSLLQAVGLPLASAEAEPLRISAVVAAKDEGLSLLDIKGQALGRSFSGDLLYANDHSFLGDLKTDSLSVQEALALAFAPWRGLAANMTDDFADPATSPLKGELFLHPKLFDVGSGQELPEVLAGFGFDTSRRELTLNSTGDQGLKLDVSLNNTGDSRTLKGELRWPLDVSQVLKSASGNSLAKGSLSVDGTFTAVGRSPAAALQAVDGKGTYALKGFELSSLTLEGFSTAVLAAKTPDELSAALAKLESSPGTAIGERDGSFTVTTGNVVFTPFSPQSVGLNVVVQPKMDLASGQLDVATTVAFADRPDLPAVVVGYSGPPGNVSVRNANSALAAKLGYDLLSKEMAELERLQKEQEALAAKEEAQRQDDDKRFAEYQATRVELREQGRIRKFHASLRDARARELSELMTLALKASPAVANAELSMQARRSDIWRAARQQPQ